MNTKLKVRQIQNPERTKGEDVRHEGGVSSLCGKVTLVVNLVF
jgi:hypothetical protein